MDGLLVLADGTVLRGQGFGAKGTAIGEVVFNTGMSGYQEVITDPSYTGQLITFTYPELGNTGVNQEDLEADAPAVKAVLCRCLAPEPSNWRSSGRLEEWLAEHGVVGLKGIDTRAVVRQLREGGAINGAVSTDGTSPAELLKQVLAAPSMAGQNLAERVTTTHAYRWSSPTAAAFDQRLQEQPAERYRVVAIDFGIKRAILERLSAHGCDVEVLPASSDAETVLALKPDGVFLSNGPGDPSAVGSGIALAKQLLADPALPMFGICLGHQILGLALGGSTFKLGYGHRGLNHPCGGSGLVEITSQNHGFALDANSLDPQRVATDLTRSTHHHVVGVDRVTITDQLVHGPVLSLREPIGLNHDRRRTHSSQTNWSGC